MATEPGPQTVKDALARASRRLNAIGDNPRLDAELLLCHALGCQRTALYAHPQRPLDAAQSACFEKLLAQRAAGMPVAYLRGQQEFWSLPLRVSEAVLIPRADTELLVQTALDLLATRGSQVLELGTGSGAIALALASQRPDLQITACDISAAALAVAKANAEALALNTVHFVQSDWFANLPAQLFDIIVCNPPYIREQDPHLQDVGVRFEPRRALVSGRDGLQAIRHIAQCARGYLAADARLVLEHGYDQGPEVCSILSDRGYTDVITLRDAGGNERVTHALL